MSTQTIAPLPDGIPPNVQTVLRDFLDEARMQLGADLSSAVLFGSAAEGRLRATSDVNLILVLKSFSASAAAALSGPLGLAKAAVDLRVMFLLESEIQPALDCFAQKFADILRRHYVLLGNDPFSGLRVKREAEVLRTRQVLLNLAMRMRERYTFDAKAPDALLHGIADTTGPLRTCAMSILELEGTAAASPREAFAKVIQSLDAGLNYLPEYFSKLREGEPPAEPQPPALVNDLLHVMAAMRQRVEAL